jgi:uncharacterized RDD family membrane protein YckC
MLLWYIIHSSLSPIYIIHSSLSPIYSILLHGFFGQTLGKMATGVIVIDASEQGELSMSQAIRRDIVPVITSFLSIAVIFRPILRGNTFPNRASWPMGLWILSFSSALWFLLEFITMLTNQRRRAVHDLIAGSVVVKKIVLNNH